MADDGKKDESFGALFEARPRTAARTVRLAVGEELEVTVVQIGKDAVFVGLDEKREGFIEAAELLAPSGELAVKVGSRIRAKIVELEGRPGAVRLTPIAVSRAPDEAGEGPVALAVSGSSSTLTVGSAIRGTVAAIERFGVFLQIGPAKSRGVRGLIPVTELGLPRGADLYKTFPLGTELDAKVIDIDDRGRIRLSLTQLMADEERKSFEAFEKKAKGVVSEASSKGNRFGTLGDLLSKKMPKAR